MNDSPDPDTESNPTADPQQNVQQNTDVHANVEAGVADSADDESAAAVEQPSPPPLGPVDGVTPSPVEALEEAAPEPAEDQLGGEGHDNLDSQPSEDGDVSIEGEAAETPAEVSNAELEKKLDELSGRFGTLETETVAHFKKSFDVLYGEMRQYKDNFAFETKRELLNDLIILYDSIQRLTQFYRDSESPVPNLVPNLEGLLVEAEEILARRDIELIEPISDKFDRTTQKASKVVPTAVPEEDLQVCEKIKNGFMFGDRPFRKEEVVIKKYSPPAETHDPEPNDAVPDSA